MTESVFVSERLSLQEKVQLVGEALLADLREAYPRSSFSGRMVVWEQTYYGTELGVHPGYQVDGKVEMPRSFLSPLRLVSSHRLAVRPIALVYGHPDLHGSIRNLRIYPEEVAKVAIASVANSSRASEAFFGPRNKLCHAVTQEHSVYKVYMRPRGLLEEAFGEQFRGHPFEIQNTS